MKLFQAILLLVNAASIANAFRWTLNDLLPSKKVLTFSERYMFPTGNGPPMLEQGQAYINVDANILVYMLKNESAKVGYAVFAAEEGHHHDNLIGICDDTVRSNEWAISPHSITVDTEYVGLETVEDIRIAELGIYHLWKAQIHYSYSVRHQEWHNVAFQLCTEPDQGPVAKVEGEVTFRNPYGFIPAELFGFLPFEGARMVAYFLLGVAYLYFFFKHQESILPLHQGVLFVFLVALAEATSWYAAYQTINLTGQPYCCPFPSTVVASLVLQIFRQSFARSLLLVVSLGYGIVRPKLLPAEWVAVSLMSALYFAAATIAQVSQIVLVNDIHGDSRDSVMAYQVPELVMDVLFLSWIYIALGSTIRILTEFQQGYKLNLYKKLANVIVIFVGLFVAASVLILLDKSGIINWPWQWAWAQQVLWEVLNFAVLAAVCIICCPSDNSRRLSYASQLPTDDPDDDDYTRTGYPGDGFEDEDGVGTGYMEDDQEEAILGSGSVEPDVEMTSWRSKLSSGMGSPSASKPSGAHSASGTGSHKFSSLPDAEDEDGDREFGLDEGRR